MTPFRHPLRVNGGAMDFELYKDVVLVRDVPEENLCAGDVGTIVERHEIVGREVGYSVEFF